jgi:hypothetical protein
VPPNVIQTPSGSCFVTNPLNLTFDLGPIPVPLTGVRAAAQYIGGPPATALGTQVLQTGNGLLRGFLTEAAAEAIFLPNDLPLPGLNGVPLAKLFRGGEGNCTRKCVPPATYTPVPAGSPTPTPIFCQTTAGCPAGESCNFVVAGAVDDGDKACATGQTNAGVPCTNDGDCIPGGAGTCQSGWFFYMNFRADFVPFTDPSPTPTPP